MLFRQNNFLLLEENIKTKHKLFYIIIIFEYYYQARQQLSVMAEPIPDQVSVVPSFGVVLANNFQLAWNAGTILFTEKKGAKTLNEAFQAAVGLCKSDLYLVQQTLSAHQILLDMIIERDNSDFKAEEKLNGLGNDIAKLIQFLNK